jgi:predicted RNA binding protein YcfA (HicA-like mRNA interferase family)
MNATHRTARPLDIRKRLLAEGWQERSGKGDHRNFTKPGARHLITLDMGARDIPIGTLRSIYRIAGWDWGEGR